jgi:hypothetical protein
MAQSDQGHLVDLRGVYETENGTPAAETTPAPVLHDAQRFVQTTYTTCVTFPNSVHCGVHEPILDASNGAGSMRRRGYAGAATAGGIVVLVLFLA